MQRPLLTSQASFACESGGDHSPQSVGGLISDADEALAAASKLREKLAKQQRHGREKRLDHARKVGAAFHSNCEFLQNERERLEAELADQLRRIHELELSSMEASTSLRERRQDVRGMARKLNVLRKVNINVTEMAGNEFRGMRDMRLKMEAQARNIQGELQEAYSRKEQVEFAIAEHRQAIAINEALYRARIEMPHAAQGLVETINAATETSDEAARDLPPLSLSAHEAGVLL